MASTDSIEVTETDKEGNICVQVRMFDSIYSCILREAQGVFQLLSLSPAN